MVGQEVGASVISMGTVTLIWQIPWESRKPAVQAEQSPVWPLQEVQLALHDCAAWQRPVELTKTKLLAH